MRHHRTHWTTYALSILASACGASPRVPPSPPVITLVAAPFVACVSRGPGRAECVSREGRYIYSTRRLAEHAEIHSVALQDLFSGVVLGTDAGLFFVRGDRFVSGAISHVVSVNTTCALRGDHRLWCDNSPAPMTGTYRELASSGGTVCGLTFDGQVTCRRGSLEPFRFGENVTAISGRRGIATCALSASEVHCRSGDNERVFPSINGVSHVQTAGSVAIARKGQQWWAVGHDTFIACGRDLASQEWVRLPCLDGADQVVTTGRAICALRDGNVTCWGTLYEGERLHQGTFTLFDDDADVPVITLGDGAPESQEP